jgi:solute carrier family 10 (sodium/bile acid cotransporter), member 7
LNLYLFEWIISHYLITLVISGLSLPTEEFKNAFKQIKIHSFIQAYNFFFISAIVYGITRILITTNAMVRPLADGMVICSSLPMAINMVIIMSHNADGDVSVAVFNSAFGNMLGVFLSPGLILGYLGVSGDVDLGEIFYKLVLRVVVPIVAGQIARIGFSVVATMVSKYKTFCSKSQMYALLFIVYTVFCDTFATGAAVETGNFVLALFFQLILLLVFMIIAWFSLRYIFPNDPQLCVTGVMGCCFKTVSLGVPLINSMYEGSPNLALYILPLLMWYPMQLTIGSLLTPHMYKFVQKEKERLSAVGVVVQEEVVDEDKKKQDDE